ncbi:MAG: hypothetical protein KIS79_03455 [Burkholderiales bacterium]|nr:hypothetical protein [Burkholderiales bacterium]
MRERKRFAVIVAVPLSLAAFLPLPGAAHEFAHPLPSDFVLAMGPDPGGHSGEQVTPKSTKTGRADIDAKREQASGDRVEITPAPKDQSPPRADK